jgi:hypothetical protein
MAKKETLKDWFSKNQGKGWIDCKTGKMAEKKQQLAVLLLQLEAKELLWQTD